MMMLAMSPMSSLMYQTDFIHIMARKVQETSCQFMAE